MKNILLVFLMISTIATISIARSYNEAKYKTVQIGDELKMVCNNLNDIATVQWFKDGVAITGETSDKLIFRNANLSHEGTYWAVVDGVCGITRTNDMVVQVEVPFQPGVETAVAGGDFLFQSEPNPASDRFRIKFNLSKTTHARLTLNDARGKEIVVIYDNIAGSGFHNFEINAIEKKLSNGVYFFTLITPDYQETKSLLIMK
ncbi:MAG: T9SS type A sorting domain-containing protein [Candidatus Kapabacteria bacterium]|nr:T9SS type A sorting domain-containing protein [Ignavibacteriota bacterium]MCW5884108.1 T9SS type A sorting domain-containing protein [Candidatus Kapabacteria bacterium]